MDPVADALTKSRGRALVAFFYHPRCPLRQIAEASVWSDPGVRAWLAADGAVLRVDTDERPDLIDVHRVTDLPLLVFFGRDGTERGRLRGLQDAAEVLRAGRAAAAGLDLLEEAAAAAAEKETPWEWHRLAELLDQGGRREEALAALRRAVEARAKAPCPNCVGLRPFAEAAAWMGRRHPPALRYLRELRERAEERLREVGANDDAADDFVDACLALRDERRVHELFEGSEAGPVRRLLAPRTERLRLAETRRVEKRSDDPADVPELERRVAEHLRPKPVPRDDITLPLMERVGLRAGAGALFERLVAEGREEEARAVCAAVSRIDGSWSLWTNLIRIAEGAGAAGLARELRARALEDLPRLPLNERAELRSLLEQKL